MFIHFHTYLFSHEDCVGSSPMRTRNTSWFSAISNAFAGSSLHQDGTKQGRGCNPSHGPWPDSEPPSLGCSQQDLSHQSFLGHSDHRIIVVEFSPSDKSGSTFRAFPISPLHTLPRSVTPWKLHKNHILVACTWDRSLSVITKIHEHSVGEDQMGTKSSKTWVYTTIPLSNDTVQQRIEEMATDVEEHVTEVLKSQGILQLTQQRVNWHE